MKRMSPQARLYQNQLRGEGDHQREQRWKMLQPRPPQQLESHGARRTEHLRSRWRTMKLMSFLLTKTETPENRSRLLFDVKKRSSKCLTEKSQTTKSPSLKKNPS